MAYWKALNGFEIEHQGIKAAKKVSEEKDDDTDERDSGQQLVQVLGDSLYHVHGRFVDINDQNQVKALEVNRTLPERERCNLLRMWRKRNAIRS